jgi:hypothetical protein
MMQKTTGVGFRVTPDDLIGRERKEGRSRWEEREHVHAVTFG